MKMKFQITVFKTLRSKVLRSTAVAVLAAFGLPLSVGASEADAPYYVYDGKRIALGLDRSTAVVKESASQSSQEQPADAAPASGPALPAWKRIGLSGAAGEAADSPETAQATANDATAAEVGEVRAAVAALAASEDYEFVSPLFYGPGGEAMSATSVLLAGFSEGQAPASVIASFKRAEITGFEQIGESGVWKIFTSLQDGFAVLDLANALASHPGVAYAEVDFAVEVSPQLRPSDPLYPQAWGLRNTGQLGGLAGFDMNAEAAWDVTTGSSSVIVLVLDDGVQLNHPDLNVAFGRDFTGNGGNGGPVFSTTRYRDAHGTAVAGVIAARMNNGIGTVGIAPGVRIASAKIAVWDDQRTNTQFQYSWVISALDWGRSIGARVSNSSWGGGSPSSSLENAFVQTRNQGMLHFAATGNDHASSISYPARYASVAAVGAANRYGNRQSFSNYGAGLEFLAPGYDIVTIDRTGSAGYGSGDYAWVDGTSFAAPYAAGVAALLLSREPSLSPAQVLERMRQSCRDMHTSGYDTVTGWGLINAFLTLVPGGAPEDDHGSDFDTATQVSFPSQTDGVIETSGNEDFFRFSLSQTTDVRIASVSSMDPVGYLYDVNRNLLGYNDDAFLSPNVRDFVIERRLSPGTYFVRVHAYGSGTGSYRLDVGGSVAASPSIRLESHGGQTIQNGSQSPSSGNGTLFPEVTDRHGSTSATYVVRNPGSGTLQLTGSPLASITGPGAGQFRIVVPPSTSVSPGTSTSFRIEFAPIAEGTHDATVTVRSNDPQTAAYSFVVRGTAHFPAAVPVRDDHGSSIGAATRIARRASIGGQLEVAGNEDFFRFQVRGRTQRNRQGKRRNRPERVRVFTTGSTDTYGYLMRGHRTIAFNGNSGEGHNFNINRLLNRGAYFVRVRGHGDATGPYTLHVR